MNSFVIGVHGAANNGVAPPYWSSLEGQVERQENDNGRNGKTSVKTSRGDVVVVRPPASVSVLNELVEDESGETPGGVVDGCGRRNLARTAEDDGCVEVSEVGLGEHAGKEVEEGWGNGTSDEEVQQAVVDLASREDTLGTDETPNDGGSKENVATWAGEVTGVVGRAEELDGTESPLENGDLHNTRPDGSNKLGPEQSSWRDFHV